MLLRVLYEYAMAEGLVDEIELTRRTVHLAIVLKADGSVDPASAWLPQIETVEGKDGEKRSLLGKSFAMPRFPGENNGGKAHFLADLCGPVLGLDSKSGTPLPDDPKAGKNATKGFLHFWGRIGRAHSATGLPELAVMLAFHARYLGSVSERGSLPFVGIVPSGKKAEPTLCAITGNDAIPFEGRVITFSYRGLPVFHAGGALHDYWKTAYRDEAFASAKGDDRSKRGLCLVTGEDDQSIAGSHKPEIKGVPGLPPKGGYLVSFAREAPAFSSYGFEGTLNAPVSEQAVAGYALALNDLLRPDKPYARTINNDFVVCSWIKDEPDLSARINGVLVEPTEGTLNKVIDDCLFKGKSSETMTPAHYHSMTLVSNGGRVVVRRWLDVPLPQLVDHLRSWFEDLEIEEIARQSSGMGKASKAVRSGETTSLPYRSVHSLAGSTARTPGDVHSSVYDALYRAALEGRATSPEALLPSALHRLRIAAIQSGANVRYQTSRFALIKLILARTKELPMAIEPQLCETHDSPYNCGRLLAILDDIQFAAQGNVGADILARYYGNASTYPQNVFSRLLRLARTHLNKLSRDNPGASFALQERLNEVCALFTSAGHDGAPEFPGQLSIREQGRFALGFHQQKAKGDRERRERQKAKVDQAVNAGTENQS